MLYIIIILMTILGALGSLYLKKSTMNIKSFVEVPRHWPFYLGAFLYFISAILNIIALQYLDYSIVLPLTSLTYIWTLIIARFHLKELVSKYQIFGVICIISGVLIITIND